MVECDENSGDIYTFNNMWFKPTIDEMKYDTEKGINCPTGFCRHCDLPGEKTTTCKFDINNQCASGRDQSSFLCSKCEKGSYLAWGSTHCFKGKLDEGKNIGKIILLIVAVIGVLAILVFLNIDIYESYLASVIFFYQVAELFLTITQYYDGRLQLLFSICNLEGAGSDDDSFNVHFISSFNAHSKAIPSYVLIAFAFIALTVLIHIRACIYERYRNKSKKKFIVYFLPEANYNACVFIIFYLYGAFFQVCIRSVGLIHFKEYRLHREPSTALSDVSDVNLAIFGLAIIFIILASIFPFFIIVDVCGFTRYNDLLRHIVYLFKAPFRTNIKPKMWYSIFPIYYMMYGNVLKITNTLTIFCNLGNQLEIMILTIISVVFLIAFMLTEPYEEKSGLVMSSNTFDTLILSLLCVVGVISTGKQKIPSYNVNDTALDLVIQVLLWVPIGLCLLLNLIKLVAFIVWLRSEDKELDSKDKFKKYMAGKYEPDHYYKIFKVKVVKNLCCCCGFKTKARNQLNRRDDHENVF